MEMMGVTKKVSERKHWQLVIMLLEKTGRWCMHNINKITCDCVNCQLRISNNKGIYYEIVGESCPLSGFFPTHADFFTEMHF